MMRIASGRSSLPHGPNIIAPRHNGLTWTPVRPSGRYFMVFLLPSRDGMNRWSGFGDISAEISQGNGCGLGSAPLAGVQAVDGCQLFAAELEIENIEVLCDALWARRFRYR